MLSKITSKYQTTIPIKVREQLHLHISDTIEWLIDNDRVVVKPSNKPFLKYQGKIKVGQGKIIEDIQKARDYRAGKFS